MSILNKVTEGINFVALRKKKKVGRFFHVSDTDLDGVGPTVLTELLEDEIPYEISRKTVFYLNATTINDNLDKVLDSLNKEDILLITDVSCNERLAERIDGMVKDGFTIVLLDHHNSALWLNKYSWAVVTASLNGVLESGTTLFYLFLKKLGVKGNAFTDEFAERVRLWDTWDWTRTNPQRVDAKQLSDLFGLYKDIRFRDTMKNSMRLSKDKFSLDKKAMERLKIEQKIIDEAFDHSNKSLHKKTIFFNDDEYKVGVCYHTFKGGYCSEIGNRLCLENDDIDFVVLIDVNNKKISMRSNKKHVDLSVICKQLGGGGHPPAAGCTLTEHLLHAFSVFTTKGKIMA